MTAHDVAVIPVVDPWPSLVVPPAWIIHLRFLDLFTQINISSLHIDNVIGVCLQ